MSINPPPPVPPKQPDAGNDGALTEQEITRAARDIQAEGGSVTRRRVRERLGRGSMTTINRVLQKMEAEQYLSLPEFILTPADQELLLAVGAQLFANLRQKVQDISSGREQALLERCAKAEAVAAEAIDAMEDLLTAARVAEQNAKNAQQVADTRATQAVEEAAVATRRALHIQGQLEVLTADREELQVRVGSSEEQVSRLGGRRTLVFS